MEELKKLIINTPNDSDLGQQVRTLMNNSPELFQDDRYIRLLAEFDNYRKRTNKEKIDLAAKAKIEALEPLLDLSDELHYAIKNSSLEDASGIQLLNNKLNAKLITHGIETVPTDIYDVDVHEVISVIGTGNQIVDVLSKGYVVNGVIYRHPKVVLG